MKSFSLAVLLAVGQVTAAPAELQAINGVIPGGPPSNIKRQIGNEGNGNGFGCKLTLQALKKYPNMTLTFFFSQACNADPIFRALRKDNDVQGASSFCSSYIRPTATVSVTVSVPTTAIVTEFATTSTTTTTTAIVTGTSTVTCAAEPTAPTTCGVEAFGFGSFLISSEPNVDPIDCHEKCLADVNCKSFQVQSGGGFCNTFNAVTAGNVQPAPGSGFTFYDRDCSDLLPVGERKANHLISETQSSRRKTVR